MRFFKGEAIILHKKVATKRVFPEIKRWQKIELRQRNGSRKHVAVAPQPKEIFTLLLS